MKTLQNILRKAALAALSLLAVQAYAQTDTVAAPAATKLPAGGRYVWVPDSLVSDVKGVIEGKAEVKFHAPDPDKDLVVVNGDTVSQVLRDRNLGRFDRGLFNYLFIPKGSWQVGITASYGKYSASDLQILDLVGDMDFGITAFSVNPYISYTVRNNISVGLRFGYTSLKGSIDNMQVDFDEDLNFNLQNVSYRNESYTSAFFVRQYIGLSRAGRFGVFNEMELAFSSGNSDFTRMYDSAPKATHTTFMSAKLNFSPGLCVFIMDNVSFNISLGVFGFYLRNEKQRSYILNPEDAEKYPDESGNRFTSGASFRFNIFNINFGLGIHF
ncbi:MAG: hypothetical protein K2M14_05955 [Muribaculaceae bacterium]|nr:hypothetical protein [Muribaculaceae bacterium]